MAAPSFWLLALSAFAAVSQGCAPGPAKSNQIPASDLDNAREIARNSEVSCASQTEADCPESVALLTNTSPTYAAQCTSWVVGPDLMATNSHCIPDDLKQAGSDCRDRMWVRFPDRPGRPGEQAGCASIVMASPKSDVADPDYAFFKIDRSLTRRPIEVSHEGLPDGSILDAIKIDPMSDERAIGRLIKAPCRAVQYSIAAATFDTDLAKVALIGDCEIIHGNSGSPLLDADGKARAIVHATFEHPEKLHQKLVKDGLTALSSEPSHLGLATGFACLRLASEPASLSLPEGCKDLETRDYSNEAIDDRFSSALALSLFADSARALDSAVASGALTERAFYDFGWIIHRVPKGSATEADLAERNGVKPKDAVEFVTARPRCIKATAVPNGASERAVNLPAWLATAGFNRYFQFRYKLGPVSGQGLHATLRQEAYDPVTRQALVSLRAGQERIFEGPVPACD